MTTTPASTLDPVCGMSVDPAGAAASVEHGGQTHSFCSHNCHKSFVEDPSRYVTAAPEHTSHEHHSH